MAVSSSSDEKKTSASAKKPAVKSPVRKKAAKKKVSKKKVVSKKVVAKKRPSTTAGRRKSPARRAAAPKISLRERYEMIAKMAYFRAEKRGFASGWEQEDWLESERLIDEMLQKM